MKHTLTLQVDSMEATMLAHLLNGELDNCEAKAKMAVPVYANFYAERAASIRKMLECVRKVQRD